MRKKTAPIDRIARMPSPIGDTARERRIDIAYRAYVLKALRRFELEGTSESIREHRTPAPPLLSVDDGVRDPTGAGSPLDAASLEAASKRPTTGRFG